MRPFKISAIALALMVLVAMIACNDSGVDETTTLESGDEDTYTTTQTSAAVVDTSLEPGTVAVYFMACYDAWEETLQGHGTASGATYGVFRYLPLTGELTLVEEQASADYADQRIYPYTVDGRLFLVDGGEDYSSIDELDPSNNEGLSAHAWIHHYWTPNWSDFAIVGDRIYYRPASTVWSSSDLKVYNLIGDAKDRCILEGGHDDNIGELMSAGGNLYRFLIPFYRDSDFYRDFLAIYRVDLTTGENAEIITSLEVDTPQDFTLYHAIDQDAIWIASKHKDYATIELFRLALTDADEALPELMLSQPVHGETASLAGLDVDDGYVVFYYIASGTSNGSQYWDTWLVFYDYNTEEFSTYQPDCDPSHVEILKVR